MRAVFSAIIASLKTLASAAASALSWPLRFLFGAGGAPSREPIDPPAPPLETIPEVPMDNTELYRRIAIALRAWAAESLLADELKTVPTTWPRCVQEFARGLTRDECFSIIDAPEYAVNGHISETFPMPGVRKLQPLRAERWNRQEPLDPCRMSPGFATLTEAAVAP
ncbi:MULTISPECIES: hypothetical protein [Bradyrhizobium]|uniref:hypothetical protein n=1 Tax=Bradyrhizobium TaxID=374 RepID=UPI001EDA504C|nr:hypothetical protein [Bradyrhizobium zhengyangense]MCG2645713.1 hypothetical protein [Bradyrhizobium zhengyangense]